MVSIRFESARIVKKVYYLLKDEIKLEKWRPAAVKAVKKQDFNELREYIQAYCDRNNMICFSDEQCRMLAKNLTGNSVSF